MRLRYLLIIPVLLTSLSLSLINSVKAKALSGSEFKAGRIIDDVIFTNKSSMTTAQIQNFLNAKVPNCDTNGTQPAYDYGRSDLTHAQYAATRGWHGPPYTCLKDYQEGGKSAAQIIWEASQTYNINPQAMIVLLQKEQALVTDNWPLQSQLTKATGYLCPDTAPCNASAGGFSKQVIGAAWQFRNDLNGIDSPGFYSFYGKGLNNILYSPNSACGTKSVYIENQATAVLYKYTPYTPNQSALDNLYGSGDGCGAYGNRNFWRYFNDWFGSTLTDAYDPAGALDLVQSIPSSGVRIAGWGFDRSMPADQPAQIHVYIDNEWGGIVTANTSRPDAGSIFGTGNNHGFDSVIPKQLNSGSHRLCAWVVGDSLGSLNYGLGCKVFNVNSDPAGALDLVQSIPSSGVRIAGWGFDRSMPADQPAQIHVYIDNEWGGIVTANTSRPDAGSIFGTGNNHGFDSVIPKQLNSGSHRLCAWVVGDSLGSLNYGLGCKVFNVNSDPAGALDLVQSIPSSGVRIAGWGFDRSMPADQPAQIHVYIDNEWGGIVTANTSRPDAGSILGQVIIMVLIPSYQNSLIVVAIGFVPGLLAIVLVR